MAKRGFNGVMMRGYGARDHDVVVTGTEMLAPKFKRIWMHSDTLLTDAVVAPTAYLRFWFPDPDKPDFEQNRGYTLAQADAETGDFACDFVLHTPAGPACAWAASATPGTTVQATSLGSTRFDLPEDLPAGYLLIGDAASLPAINGILAQLPPDIPSEVYLEQHDPDDLLIPMTEHPRATVRWVTRNGEESLAAAIEARDWSDWFVWTAPESGSLKHLRKRLRDEFGFPKSETHAQAYWYYGRAFGSNRSKAAPEETVQAATVQEDAPSHQTAPRGRWRSQAGGRLLAPLKPSFIAAGIAQGIIALLDLAPYVLLIELARLLLAGAQAPRLWAVGLWAVGLMVAGIVLQAALMFWLHWRDTRFSHALQERLLAKLARVPLGWFDRRGSGRVKQVIQDDTLALHYLVTHAVPDAVDAAVAPVAVLVYLFVVDWRLALVLILPVLAYLMAMTVMAFQSGPRTREYPTWVEGMNVQAGAYLDGQPVIRAFGGAAAAPFRAHLNRYIRFLHDWQRPLTAQKTFIDQVTRPATFLVLICLFGTLLITTGHMAAIDLLPFLFLGTTFGSRLLGIGYGLGGLQEGLQAAKRIQNVLDTPELQTLEAGTQKSIGDVGSGRAAEAVAAPAGTSGPAAGRVEIDGVGFSYRPGVPVLRDVTLTLEPGTLTALVGPSGSGKSTLAALLARFYDVGTGAIRIDGRDLRELTPDELYARVGFVFQDIQLVAGTVRENIALADPRASDERVVAAARAARIHDRILELPEAYDTVLGPDAALSGGEKQRLTIARAILADTPVLVLDEATAFADPESEYLVQEALSALAAGRTVVVIAHRLHTITGADRIVVLDHGAVAETGTHEQLLASGGRYRRLWDAGATPDSVPEASPDYEPAPVPTATDPTGSTGSTGPSGSTGSTGSTGQTVPTEGAMR